MDKELNSIADDIIKDSFGTAAPGAEPTPAAQPVNPQGPSRPSNGDPFGAPAAARPVNTINSRINNPANAPVTPRESFTAEVPKPPRNPAAMPTMNRPRPVTNEYSRIKEQMIAARENSNLPNVPETPQAEMPKQGLNKVILLFIILIPVVVVVAGVIIALLNQPTKTETASQTENQPTYIDPKSTATTIDLSTYTDEIAITEAGYYILTGETTFPIKVNAPGEVTLYLHNITVTATDASAISNFSENPLVIFLDDDTESTLAVTDPETFDSIYSEGDLTIDGATGILNVSGIKIADGRHYDVTGNGIKDSKQVVIEPNVSPSPDEVTGPSEGETAEAPEPTDLGEKRLAEE